MTLGSNDEILLLPSTAIKQLNSSENQIGEETKLFNGMTRSQLSKLVENEVDGTKMAKKMLLTVFTKEYIASHSITGQKANSKNDTVREGMDSETVSAIKSILVDKLAETSVAVHGHIQNVQRVIRAEFRSKYKNK